MSAEGETAVEEPVTQNGNHEESTDADKPVNGANALSKNARKKNKKKKKKHAKNQEDTRRDLPEGEKIPDDVEIQYVPEKIDFQLDDPQMSAFAAVFDKFKMEERSLDDDALLRSALKDADVAYVRLQKQKEDEEKKKMEGGSDEEDEKDEDAEKEKPSKKQLKKLTRLSVAELKTLVPRPDLVEMWDITAQDPKLLIHLKAVRNSVPVPKHWNQKRKYLQNKRGIEKIPFRLPQFIEDTGIAEMRAAIQEKEEAQGIKGKARERARPKMGKVEIDYQKLHDAFFRYQTKPRMTIHGDLYYEQKENELHFSDKKPGELSNDLRDALGMPTKGGVGDLVPPPWLIAMQRYGPPPSYPQLRIAGLNAPIPQGASFGYHPGGWGKPPVDEFGRPLYGDVFGTDPGRIEVVEVNVDKHTKWGEVVSEEEESEEEESEEEEEDEEDEKEEEEQGDDEGIKSTTGLETPGGISSIPQGLETPDFIELRKRKVEEEMDSGEAPSLYTVIPEKKGVGAGTGFMGTSVTYDVSGVGKGKKVEGVDIALDPTQLEDEDAIRKAYEDRLKEQRGSDEEDFSDMVAEHAAKQAKKRKKQQQDKDKDRSTKKYKEFKF